MRKKSQLEENGCKVLAPRLSNVKLSKNGFIFFEDDISDNPIVIESNFIEKCLKFENILICDKDEYVGNTVMFEIGFLLANEKKIEFIQEPNEQWLIHVVDYFLRLNKTLSKRCNF